MPTRIYEAMYQKSCAETRKKKKKREKACRCAFERLFKVCERGQCLRRLQWNTIDEKQHQMKQKKKKEREQRGSFCHASEWPA